MSKEAIQFQEYYKSEITDQVRQARCLLRIVTKLVRTHQKKYLNTKRTLRTKESMHYRNKPHISFMTAAQERATLRLMAKWNLMNNGLLEAKSALARAINLISRKG